jgi:hypothetical protein
MIPIPPAFAIAIAIVDSVTVSIADETTGTAKVIFRVRRVDVSTSEGTTSDASGRRRTSSYVRPRSATFSESIMAAPLYSYESAVYLLN